MGRGGRTVPPGLGGGHLSSQAPGQPPPLVYPVQCLRLCTLGGGDEVQGGGVESALSDEGQASSTRALWEPLAAWRLLGGGKRVGGARESGGQCSSAHSTAPLSPYNRLPQDAPWAQSRGGVKGRGRLGTNIRRSVRGGGSARGEAGGSATGPRHSCQGGGSWSKPPHPPPQQRESDSFPLSVSIAQSFKGGGPPAGLKTSGGGLAGSGSS